mmetsp:Transcript_1/g.1  ORF Transcript_1/g.1 Transcript_1/m.1 type:complete len:352 (+) Transcript_1:106-1161(+)|eukprot:scaffold111_cov149-Amphora_coffeaeformis.AAC.6
MRVVGGTARLIPWMLSSWVSSPVVVALHHHRDAFAHRLFHATRIRSRRLAATKSPADSELAARRRVEHTINKLSKNKQAWPRFCPMVDMALQQLNSSKTNRRITSVADIGTDHGLLAFGLASSGVFDQVTGVDVSERALQDGAWTLLEQLRSLQIEVPRGLSFQVGNGLQGLEPRQADMACLAGMGVNTMMGILSATTNTTTSCHGSSPPDDLRPELLLDHLGTQVLLVQPTNTRPRNLLSLYDHLYRQGFTAVQERLVVLVGRWYLSTAFVKVVRERLSNNHANTEASLPVEEFPLSRLAANYPSDQLFQGYLEHHVKWLQKEEQQAGKLRGREDEWLAMFENYLLDDMM